MSTTIGSLTNSEPVLPRILAIVGPTAIGKSDLAVELALRFNGEVVSADSRQVYRGLDIGTGKITKEEMRGVPHHLLDVADPDHIFTVAEYLTLAERAVRDILSRGKLPIVCGGTGFYIHALIDGAIFPEVSADPDLRTALAAKSLDELRAALSDADPAKAAALAANPSDWKNPRRIIRAIEIAKALGAAPTSLDVEPKYDSLFIGLALPIDELRARIRTRLEKRIDAGIIVEAERLHRPHSAGGAGLSWERMDQLGLEYRYLARFLQSPQTAADKQRLIDELALEIGRYAKRQMTWFRRDQRIKWFAPHDTSDIIDLIQKEIATGSGVTMSRS